MIDYKSNPFYLNDQDIAWVEDTLAGMSVDEKIGQLFLTVGFSFEEEKLREIAQTHHFGGIMFRPGDGESVQEAHRILQRYAKIPMLTAANLECGGAGVAVEGTTYGKPMQASATMDPEAGYKLGKISCVEGAAVGCNWAFAPIVDIDMNFRNPITNLRTFGDDVATIIKMAKGYMRAADEEQVAVAIKHFPGDGVDERDQHLLTSVNSLSVKEWDNTYGRIYSELINAGAKTVMVGHIAQPAYVHHINSDISPNKITPASLSPELLQGLLREKLGFNGLIASDATPMLGFSTNMKRADAVPYAIAAGCDMFLFVRSLEEDVAYMHAGYHNGVLSDVRLNEAVSRILALKASLGLHRKQKAGTLVPDKEALKTVLRQEKYLQWAKESADRSVTLVKDTAELLPVSPAKYKRVFLNVLEESMEMNTPLKQEWVNRLEKEGFVVTVHDRRLITPEMATLSDGQPGSESMEKLMESFGSCADFVSKYDMALYVANYETASNNTVVRLNWETLAGMGNDVPWFVKELPTIFVSTANPYHLLDVPMIPTFINAYTFTQFTVEAVVDKLVGRSEFKGSSPVDPFCGYRDTKQ